MVQENHFGPLGELLEGISSNSVIYPYLFQSKEREFAWGLSLDDFMTRTYDPFTGRMWQVDGADQFASGYVGMGNNAVNGIDPDGQLFFVPILIGAAVGGLGNLAYQAWQGKVTGLGSGLKAFGVGAVAGGAAVLAPQLIGTLGGVALTTSTGYVASGAVAGAVSGSVAGAVQGFGNALAFNNGRGAGRDALVGAVGGGLFGGATGGIAAWIGGKNAWTGAPRASGAGALSFRNADMLQQQGWTRTAQGRWSNVVAEPMTYGGADVGDGVFRDFAGTKVGQTLGNGTNSGSNAIARLIDIGKQGKHIIGHNNYQSGKSILTEDAQQLLDAFHSGNVNSIQVINNVKTRVNFGKTIGNVFIDGVSTPTTNGIIHNAKSGAHIVPSAPK
jgi:hypothetical protein